MAAIGLGQFPRVIGPVVAKKRLRCALTEVSGVKNCLNFPGRGAISMRGLGANSSKGNESNHTASSGKVIYSSEVRSAQSGSYPWMRASSSGERNFVCTNDRTSCSSYNRLVTT